MTVRAASPDAGTPDSGQQIDLCLKHAEMLGAQGRFAEALEALDPGLAVDPQNVYLLHERAWVLLNLWRVDEAQFTLEQLLGVYPDLASARYLLAHALLQQNKHQQAERENDICLAAEPDNPDFLLQSAQILVSATPELRDRRELKRVVLARVNQAVASASETPGVMVGAARLQWALGRASDALKTCQLGLAEAPQDAKLLELHAELTTVNTPATGHGAMEQEIVYAVEMGKLLAADPQHRNARAALFAQLWFRFMTRIDAPVYLTAIVALGVLTGFAGSTADPRLVAVWWVIALILGGIQWARFGVLSKRIPRNFRAYVAGSGPIDLARRWGEWAVLGALLASGVAAVTIAATTRDAVAVRWIIVALCLIVALAFACSLAWQLGYLARVRRVEGGITDRDAIVRLAAFRHNHVLLVRLRCLEVVGLWLLFGALYSAAGATQSRGDAAAVVLIATSAMVLSPLVGWFTVWLAEQRARGELEGTVTVNTRPPALWSLFVAATLAAGMCISLTAGAMMTPVVSSEYDAVGQYELKAPRTKPDTGDTSDVETCNGRRTSRLACQLERTRELSQRPVEMPDLPDPIDMRKLIDSLTE